MKASTFQISPRVRGARAVVALESTIVAHGMPYPVNVETARAVERIVEEEGATPATVGVMGGEVVVGLGAAQIEHLGTSGSVMKAGERDLAVARARRLDAATTAGASAAIASAAGIEVFVTGGIGGVGPYARDDFDISADLAALASYPVVTVCAGAKAFMDIAGTLELLETLRVPVVGYGTDDFPLFYTAHSGHAVSARAGSPEEVAALFRAHTELGMGTGMLVCVPVPEEYSLAEEELRRAMEAALERARAAGVTGKAYTPFVLAAIKEASGGRSLEANIALIQNNARVGARVARALAGV